jgi:Response regulator receiver domain
MLLGCGIDPSIGGDIVSKKKILIVEDHVEIRELMARFLERAGYEVIEAETGLTAIDRANAIHPDLITIDLGLPDITGDEVVARLKADPATKHIPGDRDHGVLRGFTTCGELRSRPAPAKFCTSLYRSEFSRTRSTRSCSCQYDKRSIRAAHNLNTCAVEPSFDLGGTCY